MTSGPVPLVAGHGRVEVAFEVDVAVVAEVVDDLDDPAAGEGELGRYQGLSGSDCLESRMNSSALSARSLDRW
jgi:hypothetical protein